MRLLSVTAYSPYRNTRIRVARTTISSCRTVQNRLSVKLTKQLAIGDYEKANRTQYYVADAVPRQATTLGLGWLSSFCYHYFTVHFNIYLSNESSEFDQ